MSISETKRLIRKHKIIPNKLLGQNFMVDSSLFPLLSEYAALDKMDIVLDAGAGFGFLTRFLADKCKTVIAVEKDPLVAEVLREQLRGVNNVSIIEGDVLRTPLPRFDKVVSIPPYYMSSHLVTWLFEQKIKRAVLILQEEFAKRLVAAIDSDNYGWLTVIACHSAEVELLDSVPRSMFYPAPKVDSVIVRFTPWSIDPFEVKNLMVFRQMVKYLFTQRNKKLCNALVPFIVSTFKISKKDAEKLATSFSFSNQRVRKLPPAAFGVISNVLAN
ncbi:MAG: 16S rRNA (adenine(1518)-N(6)/adenine(1519)-N(6))-dimethyltransferase RsmA [Candidatus Bathyarchaeota archaeon]|nr:16S rRNA (adenine(1518)-N(6)/adenine(1519)-N(6))-dimethyltransferase RsmA [Candidatus Bathyarchaeota archaeon]